MLPQDERAIFIKECNELATRYFVRGMSRWFSFDQDSHGCSWSEVDQFRGRVKLDFYQALGFAGILWQPHFDEPFNTLR